MNILRNRSSVRHYHRTSMPPRKFSLNKILSDKQPTNHRQANRSLAATDWLIDCQNSFLWTYFLKAKIHALLAYS